MDRFFEDTSWSEVLRGIAGLGKDLADFIAGHALVAAVVLVALAALWRWTMPSTR